MSPPSGISSLSSEGPRDLRCLHLDVRWWPAGPSLGGADDPMPLLETGRVQTWQPGREIQAYWGPGAVWGCGHPGDAPGTPTPGGRH